MGKTDLDFEAVKEWLEENEAPANVKQAFEGSALRKAISEKEAEIERLKPFENEVVKLRQAPDIEKGFREVANVDWDNLTKSQRAIIEDKFTFDADDKESFTKFASEWEFPTAEGAQPEAGEAQPPAARVAAQAQAQPGTVFTPPTDAQEIASAEAQALQFQREGKNAEAQAIWDQVAAAKDNMLRPEGLKATS